MILKLKNPVRPYPWGSRSYLQGLLGLPEELGKPLAELWIGAHSQAPSLIEPGGQSLAEFISHNPHPALGAAREINRDKLPYLLKVLAVAEPLSIQIHPNKAQAEAGFARENQAGIPLDDPKRNYKDNNHKPELIMALTPFRALCGLRDYGQIISSGEALGWGKFLPLWKSFVSSGTHEDFTAWFLSLMDSEARLLADLISHTDTLLDKAKLIPEDVKSLFRSLRQRYPLDLGLFFPFLLNLVNLAPGQAIFLEAGILHAYLEGNGLELMASSDNVIRAGLTPKHIDLEEFKRVCRFEPFQPELLEASQPRKTKSPRLRTFNTPVADFRLQLLDLAEGEGIVLDPQGLPSLLFCLEGKLCFGRTESPTPGIHGRAESFFITANQKPFELMGPCRLALVDIPSSGTLSGDLYETKA